MVRTKTRPLTVEERYPNGQKANYLPPKHVCTYNNRIFTDHNGNQALMSWASLSPNCPLPPLPCWVFYIVHPHKPSDFDGCAFFERLENEEGYGLTSWCRYEFFFLPGATAEECHAHYVEEIKSRGTIWDQITKVKNAIELYEEKNGKIQPNRPPIFEYSPFDRDYIEKGQLPGLVVPDHVYNEDFSYGNWFFIYADANPDCSGREGLTREIYVVEFDPIAEEEQDDEGFDHRDPIDVERVNARGEPGWERGLVDYMGRRDNSNWKREAIDATGQAFKLAWKFW
ncbi:hypothetical protein EDB82DRAFT_540345 [Fusarium venenatum]|uniref:uncharacterized protein n=1 Tax=Fusarium venenatum TaxID=56646 RepID=UPI001D5FB67C|nr:hypothetical protein EDB82DRAFT_540345 [Fusarium venenatum]